MRFLNFIKSILNWKSFWKAILDLFLIGFFTMLASFATLISLLQEKDKIINWSILYSNGNFFLYSISFFSSSLLYYLHRKKNGFGMFLLIILMTSCAISYSYYSNDTKSTTLYTKYGSIGFILLSFFIFLITQYNQHLTLPDLNDIDRNNQNAVAEGVTYR
jgi:hypothetical protein